MRLDLAAAQGVAGTFGRPGEKGPVLRASSRSFGKLRDIRGTRRRVGGGQLADGQRRTYGITQVRYGGYQWTAGLTEAGWQTDPGGNAGSIVAS